MKLLNCSFTAVQPCSASCNIYSELDGILEVIFSCCVYHWGRKRTLMSLHSVFSAWCDKFHLLDYLFSFLSYSVQQFAAVSSHSGDMLQPILF